MVATRNHPKDFEPPAPTESPTKRPPRADTTATESPTKRVTRTSETTTPPPPTTTNHTPKPTSPATFPRRTHSLTTRSTPTTWSHTPSNLTLLWLAISLPLVIWDTAYVFLRPHSMPGGYLHAPLWTPYALYGTVDYIYGFKAWDARNGFTMAQGTINLFETVAYMVYLYMMYAYGEREEATQGRGAPDQEELRGWRTLGQSRTVHGDVAVKAVLLGYSTAFLTFTKTVLYWLNEAFSGFDNIGHNSWSRLVFLWIIPNGAWLVLPAYMIYVFGQEILQALQIATAGGKKYREPR